MTLRSVCSAATLAFLMLASVNLAAHAQESLHRPDTSWEVHNREGMAAAAKADWPAAEAAFRAALDTLAAELDAAPRALDGVDADDARSAAVAGNLGVVLLQMQETEEARRLFERALAIRQAVFGRRDPAVAESLNNLAELERRTGQLEQARSLHEKALELRRRALDAGHPAIAESLNNLGMLLRDLSQNETAAAHLGEAYAIRRERLGPAHQATLESAGNLAAATIEMGDLATAGSALFDSIDALPADAPKRGGTPAYVLRQGIDVLLLENNVDRALSLCKMLVIDPLTAERAAGIPTEGPPLDLHLAELIAACARTMVRSGSEAQAKAIIEQQLSQLAPSAPTTPLIEAELRWELAEMAAVAGKLETAEAAFSQVSSLLKTVDDARLATVLNNLGSIRFERGRPIEAAEDLETALALLEKPEASAEPALMRNVLANYAVVLRTLERHDEALAAENRLTELTTNPDQPKSASTD